MINNSIPTYKLVTDAVLNISNQEGGNVTDDAGRPIGVTVVILLVTSLLTLGCILGNSLVILAVMLVHKLKTPSNFLIVSLAFSDLFVGLIVMPLAIVREVLLGVWPFGKTACAIWVTSDVTLCTASILTLMMISIDRYLIITYPFKYSRYRTTKLMVLYITLAWLVSLVISTTPLLVNWLPDYGPEGKGCNVNQQIEYQMYATFAAFYLPIMVMFGLYGKIFHIAKKISRAEAKNNPRPNNNNDQNTPSYHSSSNGSPMVDKKLNGVRKKRLDNLENTSDIETLAVGSNVSLHLDHNIVNETILENDQESPTEKDWLRKSEHHNSNHHQSHHHNGHHGTEHHSNHHHHSHHHSSHHHINNNNNHLTPEHHPHGHRHGSWPLKKLSVVTIASVRRFLHRRKHKGNSHAIKTLGVIMGLFTACWLPFFLLAVISPLCGESCSIPDWVYGAFLWLGYANSCFNPLIYARFNREFRTPFKEILCCHCHKINESVRHTDYLYQYGGTDEH